MKNITYLVVAVLLGISGIAQSSVDVSEDEYVVFYHHDVLGSPVATTDDKGRVLWYEHSQPYGKGMGRKNTDGEGFKDNAIEEASSRMGYTGHTVDNTADLVYMKARYYDPVIGRFYSNDPVGFTTANPMMFNRYAYASNNPYLYTDPTGENGVTAVGGAIVETSDAIGGFFSDTFGFGWGDGSADWGNVANALADGYDGNGDGLGSALADDALTFIPVGAALGAVSKIGKLATRFKNSFRATNSAAELSKSQLKSIKSLEKQIQKHQLKLDDFKANPTVRPGMENLPKGVIKRQQETRIEHLETEINTFRNNIEKVKNGEL